MKRYTVGFRHPETKAEISFLIPFEPIKTLATLLTEVKRRALRHSPCLVDGNLILRYHGVDGPILELDDTIGDILVDPERDIVFATTNSELGRKEVHEEAGNVCWNETYLVAMQ